jgi:hypothetical protein
MKLYIINKLYYKKANPKETLHYSTVFVTSDKTKLSKALSAANRDMVKFFEIFEEETRISQEYMQAYPDIPAGYSYSNNEIIGFLTVTTLENHDIDQQNDFKPYDIAKFKPDAIAEFRAHPGTWQHFIDTSIVQVLTMKEDTSTVLILKTDKTQHLGKVYDIQTDYLIKVNI